MSKTRSYGDVCFAGYLPESRLTAFRHLSRSYAAVDRLETAQGRREEVAVAVERAAWKGPIPHLLKLGSGAECAMLRWNNTPPCGCETQ